MEWRYSDECFRATDTNLVAVVIQQIVPGVDLSCLIDEYFLLLFQFQRIFVNELLDLSERQLVSRWNGGGLSRSDEMK